MIAVCIARYIGKTLMNTKLLFSNACFSSNFQGLPQAYRAQPKDKVAYTQMAKNKHETREASQAPVISDPLFHHVYHLLIRITPSCTHPANSILFSIGY